MMHRNKVRSAALAAIVALTIFSASTIARGSNQKPGKQTEASLMNVGQGVPDAEIFLKKKPDTQSAPAPDMPAAAPATRSPVRAMKPHKPASAAEPTEKGDERSAGNKRTNKDGSFFYENVPVGTYNLTFDAPKVSPAMAGKVEYLVIVQQVAAGSADPSTAKIYDASTSKTARIAIGKINDGFDFTVGQQPRPTDISVAKSNKKNSQAVNDSQMRKAKESKESNAPQAMNLRGKIFLVEIGTTKRVIDQPEVKSPNKQ